MTTRTILIGLGAAAALVAGAIFAWPTMPSYAAGVAVRQVHFGGYGGWHRGGGPGQGRGP